MKIGRIVAVLAATSAVAPLILGLEVGSVRRAAEEERSTEVHLSLELTPVAAYWLEWGLAASVVSCACLCYSQWLDTDTGEEEPEVPPTDAKAEASSPAEHLITIEVPASEIEDFTR